MSKEPQDPIERRRRELQEKQKQLSSELNSITQSFKKPDEAYKEQAPPVWRDDPDEEVLQQGQSLAEKRLEKRKRWRDMWGFILTLLVLAAVCCGLFYFYQIYYLPHASVISEFTHNIDAP